VNAGLPREKIVEGFKVFERQRHLAEVQLEIGDELGAAEG
jgi:hypothetical protein